MRFRLRFGGIKSHLGLGFSHLGLGKDERPGLDHGVPERGAGVQGEHHGQGAAREGGPTWDESMEGHGSAGALKGLKE